MLDNFEKLLKNGFYFDVPEDGEDWILYSSGDIEEMTEVCRGRTLEEMISRAPGSTLITFDEVEKDQSFYYLEELYTKANNIEAVGPRGPWRFLGNEEVLIK